MYIVSLALFQGILNDKLANSSGASNAEESHFESMEAGKW
jgi:hypothetical protein